MKCSYDTTKLQLWARTHGSCKYANNKLGQTYGGHAASALVVSRFPGKIFHNATMKEINLASCEASMFAYLQTTFYAWVLQAEYTPVWKVLLSSIFWIPTYINPIEYLYAMPEQVLSGEAPSMTGLASDLSGEGHRPLWVSTDDWYQGIGGGCLESHGLRGGASMDQTQPNQRNKCQLSMVLQNHRWVQAECYFVL